ncbi:flagellar basal body-associated protein FliL [Pseudooceanicola sp. C21-150M6]|uniref:flagellar basal body-associated protein FliL n=1 Tax=Pseudooceanicola sp. C21-150M6 TaxID=3434355 RepID=UPI003D7F1A15
MKKILPFLMIPIAIALGGGLGIFFRPEPPVETASAPCGDMNGAAASDRAPAEAPEPDLEDREYVKLNNQFVVPVVKGDDIASLVVLSLSLEVKKDTQDTALIHEPKLRDVFLQELFDFAHEGGFDGAYTRSTSLDVLRDSLMRVGSRVLGDDLLDVLITDIARQDY